MQLAEIMHLISSLVKANVKAFGGINIYLHYALKSLQKKDVSCDKRNPFIRNRDSASGNHPEPDKRSE